MSNDDWIAADRDHLLRMEREKTARTIARWQGAGYVAAWIAVAVVICAGIWAMWSNVEHNADRAFKAEAAVARVREEVDSWPASLDKTIAACADSVTRALDGER